MKIEKFNRKLNRQSLNDFVLNFLFTKQKPIKANKSECVRTRSL